MSSGASVPKPEDLLFTPLQRHREVERLENPAAELSSQLEKLWEGQDLSGRRIAIATGSRGIADRVDLVRATAEKLKEKGARPFVLNAMGSHGGATAEGQRALLASLGYTEQSVGCPIECSMEVVELEEGDDGPVVDRLALESDGVVVINRVKPHTSFSGPHESGLVKMLVVGLGKAEGARRIHRYGPNGLRDKLGSWASVLLEKISVVGAIGVVENALDQIMKVEVSDGGGVMELDARLLNLARPQLPGLPISETDVLILDQMGKDISGTGMDTNVIGRLLIHGQEEPADPRIGRIIVHDLTEASGGNATGVGLADVIGPQLAKKYNREVTQKNVLTTGFIQRAKLPYVASSDQEALEIALSSLHGVSAPTILRIRDTLHPDTIWVHGPLLKSLVQRDDIEVLGEPQGIFSADGELAPFDIVS